MHRACWSSCGHGGVNNDTVAYHGSLMAHKSRDALQSRRRVEVDSMVNLDATSTSTHITKLISLRVLSDMQDTLAYPPAYEPSAQADNTSRGDGSALTRLTAYMQSTTPGQITLHAYG